MSFEQWSSATRPKVQGTWNLHNKLSNLDFFVMLSSLIGVAGNSSQANYSAGGSFQDAFARYRTSQGLPAVAIDLGSIKSVGYVAETGGVAERLERIGYEAIEEAQIIRIIESAISDPLRKIESSQVITGIKSFDKTSEVAWCHDKRFSPLEKLKISSAGGLIKGNDSNVKAETVDILKDLLPKAASSSEAVDLVTQAMIVKLCEMFSLVEADVDKSMSMSRYGVDSLVAIEVRNWLALRAQAEMSIFDVLQSASLTVLAEKVAAKSRLVGGNMVSVTG